MFTYLYMASNKAKAAATEEGKKLSGRVNKTIAVEVNWKLADQTAFKSFVRRCPRTPERSFSNIESYFMLSFVTFHQ